MDPMNLLLLAVLAFFVFTLVRSNRRRQREARELQAQLVPGARVMTSFGLYGTLVSLDADENLAVVRTRSGAELELHRQAISKVVPADTIVPAATPKPATVSKAPIKTTADSAAKPAAKRASTTKAPATGSTRAAARRSPGATSGTK